MNSYEIQEKVRREVNLWEELQYRRDTHVKLSSKAIDFLCVMIINIEEDSSQIWKPENSSNSSQELAISLIPNALNELLLPRRFKVKNQDILITTWEIWHSLSRIIDRFCFVPKGI